MDLRKGDIVELLAACGIPQGPWRPWMTTEKYVEKGTVLTVLGNGEHEGGYSEAWIDVVLPSGEICHMYFRTNYRLLSGADDSDS